MKLASYNIQYGFGLDGRYDLERIARTVKHADIIALQEVERFWKRSGEDDQVDLLSRLLPQHYAVYGPAYDMDASYRDQTGAVVNRRRQFGTMLLSKFPIVWSRLHLLPMRRMIRPLNTQNAALEGMIRTPAGPLRVWSLHLAHVGADERLEEIDFLLERHHRAERTGGPWSGADDEASRRWSNDEPEPEAPLASIWMGDFNSEPGSAEYHRIVGRNPYHRGAAYRDGFVDAAVACGADSAELYTHLRHVDGRQQKRRLDFCFVGGMLANRVRSMKIDTDAQGSDHFPVFVDIDLETPGLS